LAKVAEQTERYQDMQDYLIQYIELMDFGEYLSGEENNLLSNSFKWSIQTERNIINAISAF
jgi:hypothetical protein